MTETESNNSNYKRGPYKRVERLHLIHEVERLLVKGYDSAYIIQQLKISEPTFYRLRRASFKDSKQALRGLSEDRFMELLSTSSRRLLEVREQAMKLSNDSGMEGDARVASLHLAAEIERAIVKIYVEGKTAVAQLVASKSYPSAMDSPQETVQKHLTLVKNNNEGDSCCCYCDCDDDTTNDDNGVGGEEERS